MNPDNQTTKQAGKTGRSKDGTFAPGISGNPAGRPPKAESWRELFNQELEKLIKYPDKKSPNITNKRAVVSRLISEALTGNVRAISELIEKSEPLMPDEARRDFDGVEFLK